MAQATYTFVIGVGVDLNEVNATMRLSLIAAEGVHGEARIRTEVAYTIEPLQSALRLSGDVPAVETVAQIFTSFLTREFGAESFCVRRMTSPPSESTSAAIGAAA